MRVTGYGVPIELFAPFADSCVVVMKRLIEQVAKDVPWPKRKWTVREREFLLTSLFFLLVTGFCFHCWVWPFLP